MPEITQAEIEKHDETAFDGLPMLAFYWHDRLHCYVIEHEEGLEFVTL